MPSPQPSSPRPASQEEKQYVLDPPSKFSELPGDTMYRIMLLLRTYPDTAPVTPHPPAWAGGPGYKERFYAHPDAEGPLVEDQLLHLNLAYLLDMAEGDCGMGMARALHGLNDNGIRGDLTRRTDWTKCIKSLAALECHLGELLRQRRMELEMIANRLQNAHTYPRLLPHLAAEGIIPYSWSPPTSRLLSLRAGAGPSDPPSAPRPSPPPPTTHVSSSPSSSHASSSRPRQSPRRPQTPHPSQPIWPVFHGTCNNCGAWGHKRRHCNAPVRSSRAGPDPRSSPVPRPTPHR